MIYFWSLTSGFCIGRAENEPCKFANLTLAFVPGQQFFFSSDGLEIKKWKLEECFKNIKINNSPGIGIKNNKQKKDACNCIIF